MITSGQQDVDSRASGFLVFWKEVVMSGNKGKVLYSAVVLDDESKNKLIAALQSKLPEGWTVYAHHMTIVFGKGLEDKSEIGKSVTLLATELGLSNKAMAVKVEGYPTNNKIPHITVAVNTADGGKPYNSNQIKEWQGLELTETLELRGVVTEIKQ